MDTIIWIVVAVAVLWGFAPITLGRGGRVSTTQLATLCAAVGLPLPDASTGPILARIAHRERWSLWGGAIGLALGALTAIVGRLEPGGAVIMLGVAFGGAVGGGLATVVAGHRVPAGAPRVARSRRTAVGDYVPVRHLIAARGMLAVAIVAGGVELILGATRTASDVPALLIVCVVVALPVAVLTEVVLRLVADRPQHASTSLELAWDDVLRADAAHQLVLNQVIVCALAAFAAPFSAGLFDGIGPSPVPPSGATVVVAVVVLAAAAVAVGLVTTGPWRRHPLDRLWAGRSFDPPGDDSSATRPIGASDAGRAPC
ncbi:hypothetical protein [Microbacterium sp.]|uniref:hypothetical protein n=1 Tax=Microbacterium sp. TaxID=51671 RepID=UPI0039E6662D